VGVHATGLNVEAEGSIVGERTVEVGHRDDNMVD